MSISGIFFLVIFFSIRFSHPFLTHSVQRYRDLTLFGNLRTREKLKRSHSGRKALLRALTTEVLRHGRIITTASKARQARPRIERIIKYSKYDNKRHALNLIRRYLYDSKLARRVLRMAPKRFEERHGGYCRIKKLSFCNKGDNSNRVILELLEY
ncbi:50S ribosomal protein L17, putative [Theileria equi strain WA]|uniref:50S ribosomal protein L17, putative n=1 Tax=Theileria equi strain WA TaxID=1537102 RepID=L1LA52_THEEQ|nr:50S ribosomal protein L17, putative [Theileria equi strain WA]EKX72048.1 50S ribosomal protein L17, putative [Theileria equi strain WA]|eukprot:XP_004831500.1 50S ribosomal protein L17, putative [Theileria equi strain WA]